MLLQLSEGIKNNKKWRLARATSKPSSIRVSHRCWGHRGWLLKIWWGAQLKSIHGGSMGGLKMLSKNTCEGVHLIVKLPAISLQACKFTKNELLHTYFWRILARFYWLCFFQESFHGRVLHVSMGGLFFRWGAFIFSHLLHVVSPSYCSLFEK